tara:strand:- start:1091 stop:3139 length:2049 start_codon:yes stop_codon:yes gene_type:complete
MIVNLGYTALLLALLCSFYAIVSARVYINNNKLQWVDSARNAVLSVWFLLTLACLILVYLLTNEHFEIEYVASVSSRSMPWYLKATALWGGQAGSLLFWSWLMSSYTGIMMLRDWSNERDLQPYVITASMLTLAFFVSLNVFVENPFNVLWIDSFGNITSSMTRPDANLMFTPNDGAGLNPLLRHPGMIIHPPMLYLGFVGFVIPYSFAIGALAVGRTDGVWIRATRRWTLIAWLFLSLGLLLGGRWAYDVLGWGGYWGWDPVEIAAFMPWLTGTAFLHSVIIQEKHGMFKRWNMILIILTYALVIFGTFLTRSGVLSSVHAFAQSSIGPLFFIFITVTFTISLLLLFRGWESLASRKTLTSWLSREGMFLLNNLLFMGILVACFWGVIYPLISEIITGQKVTVGPPFYERTTGPQFAALLLLMGIVPLVAWRITTVNRIGHLIWKPTIISLLVPIMSIISGIFNFAALLSLWLASLVFCVTIYEFYRGAIARSKSSGNIFFISLWQLISRNRRRYGGYIVHLGIVFMAVGIIGVEMFQTETQGTLAIEERMSLEDYSLVYKDLDEYPENDGRFVTKATLDVYKNNKLIGELEPRRDYYNISQQRMTIPDVYSTLEGDLYVLLIDWKPVGPQQATFKVYLNPLINWIWIGGFLFILGTLVATWPDQRDRHIITNNKSIAQPF